MQQLSIIGGLLIVLSGETVWAEQGFDGKYQRDFNIFNPINQYEPGNPLNPINAYDPANPCNPINQFDPGNPRQSDQPVQRQQSLQPGQSLSAGESVESYQ